MRTPAPLLLATLALAAPAFGGGGGPCQGRYIAGAPISGTDDWIATLFTQTTPQGSKLLLGGRFMVAGDKVSSHVAAWNGTSWEAMGVQLESANNVPDVSQFIYFNNTLYACGRFDKVNGQAAGGLMRWNGSAWVPWTSGASGGADIVYCMHIHNNQLYIGGWFTQVNGVAMSGIARWNGATFVSVGGFDGQIVQAITTHNGQLHVTGSFSHVNGQPFHNAARFDGAAWHPLDTGVSDGGWSIASYQNTLYVGGADGPDLGINEHDGLNYWNGAAWGALTGGDANDLKVHNNLLYAHHGYTIGDIPGHVAVWNGLSWSGFGTGIGQLVGYKPSTPGLDFLGSDMYVGGEFGLAGDTLVSNLAKWDGAGWSRVGTANASDSLPFSSVGKYNGMLAIAGRKNLLAGNTPTTVSLTSDCVNFQSLPGKIEGVPSGLTEYNGDLYAFGFISAVDGQAIEGITRWNGTQWSALGGGLAATNVNTNARVYDTAEFNGKLICAGYFNEASGTPMNRIAAWNGTTWSNLGAGTDGFINEIESFDGSLYATGDFTLAGGVSVNGCARWDGSVWHAADAGLPTYPRTLHAHGSDLFAAIGNDIYRLVGNTWQLHSTVPDGEISSDVYQLFTYRNELCARGRLGDNDGWSGGRQVMAYRNGAWTDLHPDKYNKSASDAIEFKGQLITVGQFSAVGNVVSPGLARYTPDQPYIWNQPVAPVSPCPGSTADFQLQAVGGPILVHHWYRNNTMLVNGPTGTGSTITGATLAHMQIANISSADDGLYRCEITSQCGNTTSDTVRLITYCLCGPADMGSQGGVPGPDGLLDNNDFIVFIDFFFNQNSQADVGQQGGIPGPDGVFDNNDFVVFIDLFFAGCNN